MRKKEDVPKQGETCLHCGQELTELAHTKNDLGMGQRPERQTGRGQCTWSP